MRGLCAWIVGGLMLGTCAAPVNAAIISQGSYLTDTASGLDWLDMAPTYNLTFSQVVAELAPNGALAGWTVASNAQVFQLALDAGSPALPSTNTPVLLAFNGGGALTTLVTDLGSSTISPGAVYGFNSAPGSSTNSEGVSKLLLYNPNFQSLGDSASYIVAGDPTNNPQPWIGTFLVRQTAPVPEPSSGALVICGLAVLAWRVQRSRLKSGLA